MVWEFAKAEARRMVARAYEITPVALAILQLIDELAGEGGWASTPQLYCASLLDGSAVRRATLVLEDAALIASEAADGGRVRRGTNKRCQLTPEGRLVIRDLEQLSLKLHQEAVRQLTVLADRDLEAVA